MDERRARTREIVRYWRDTHGLSVRAAHMLSKMGIEDISTLSQSDESDILAHRNVGAITVLEIKQLLQRYNMRLKPNGLALNGMSYQHKVIHLLESILRELVNMRDWQEKE